MRRAVHYLLVLLLAGLAVILATLVIHAYAHAHSWYPQNCCGDQHCHPVPCEEVSRTALGNYLWKTVEFDKKVMKLSEDDGCHVCINPNTTPGGLCIFLAPRS